MGQFLQRAWVREVAYAGFWWGNLRETDHLGDPGVDGRIILRWIFRKLNVGVRTQSSWLRIGTSAGWWTLVDVVGHILYPTTSTSYTSNNLLHVKTQRLPVQF
jgi:hypothetical protein